MSTNSASGFRADIQGLRAIAVLLVLGFHVWPKALSGGYIGVDVFFVISGFLITGLLFREFENKGRISLLGFYARRIRRLLPAATLTLVAIGIGCYVWLPQALWSDVAKEMLASGFYVENLLLVQKSVDYLALEEAPSPAQHYWSLSVEEQFYIIWPLLMIATGAVARRAGWSVRGALLASLGTVTAASLTWGIYISYVDPAPGYFLTTTRIWELGIGGLLALMRTEGSVRTPVHALLGWAGVIGVLVASHFYTTGLPFPGYEALLPTLAAAALIFARSDESSWLGRLLGKRPMQYFGDISYSLYLWHWPVVVLYPYVFGREVGQFQDGVTVIVISVFLAHLSKYGVEDRFRHGARPGAAHGFKWAYAMGVACMVMITAAAALPYTSATSLERRTIVADPMHPGAEAFLRSLSVTPAKEILPAPGSAKLDRGPAYGGNGSQRCIGEVKGTDLVSCKYGSPDARFRVVLIGDSHAAHWLPAFERAAVDYHWNFTGLTKSGCAFADVTVQYGSPGQPAKDYPECDEWKWKALEWILAQKPDLVVISESPNHRTAGMSPAQSQEVVAKGIVAMAERVRADGIAVAMIKHTPWMPLNAPTCMSKPGATIAACSGDRRKVVRDAALNMASRMDPQLRLLDFDDAFCKGDACPVVIGNVFVYRDQHHMTATFSRTLSRVVHEKIAAAYPEAN